MDFLAGIQSCATIGSSFDELSLSEDSDTPFSISVNKSLSSSLLGGSALNEVYSSKSDNHLDYSLEQSLAEETPESQILMDYLNQNCSTRVSSCEYTIGNEQIDGLDETLISKISGESELSCVSCDDNMSIIDDSEELKRLLDAIDRKNKSDSNEKEIRKNLRNVYDFSDDDEMDCPSTMFQVKVKPITGYTKPCCKSMCNLKVWPSLILQKINGFVANLSKQQIKQSLLDHLYGQRIIDGRVNCIVIMGHCFCKKGFSFLSGVSAYLIDEVFKAFNIGQVSFFHGNELGLREGEACINFTAWLTNFAKNYGNYAPDEETLVISSCYSLKDIFNIYRAECAGPHVSKSYFYKLFDYKFGPKRIDKTLPHIRISSYSTHSQCDECLLLDKFHRSCKTEGEFAYVRSLKERHRLNYAKARLAIEEHRHKSINDPDSALFIQIDDMENKVSFIFMRLMSKSFNNEHNYRSCCHLELLLLERVQVG